MLQNTRVPHCNKAQARGASAPLVLLPHPSPLHHNHHHSCCAQPVLEWRQHQRRVLCRADDALLHEAVASTSVPTASPSALPPQLVPPTDPSAYCVLNFYHLTPIADPQATVEEHRRFIERLGLDIRGRIYISSQGMNSQYGGTVEHATTYAEWVKQQPGFQGLFYTVWPADGHAFPKLRLKYKPNLISLAGGMEAMPITDPAARATPLEPAKWKEMIAQAKDKDIVVLDVRNDYEWDAGHFEGAERPAEEVFAETPVGEGEQEVPGYLKVVDKDAPVMMYCTGGIRCDVYSTFLRKKGYNNLYTLEGGVQNYFRQEGGAHWKGSLFVFDARMAIPASSEGGADAPTSAHRASAVGAEAGALRAAVPCSLCGSPDSQLPHVNCANIDCNELFIACAACKQRFDGCCCEACMSAPRLLRPAKVDGGHYGAWGNYADRDEAGLDNNGWRDFQVALVDAPSEDEVMAARAEAYRRFDEDRRRLIEEEEKRLWRLVESRALDAAAAARVEFRRRRDSELLEAARQVVADRRKADITAVPAANSVPGVYAWCGGPPRPGQRAFLAYNRVHGSSGGGLQHSGSVRLHLGYDGWWNKITQTTDLAPLTPDQLASHNLSSAGGMQWYGAWVDVPYSAAVLNFVFSDREQRSWDNNGMRDYHTLVAGAHSGDELVEMLHAAMKRDSADSDKEVEDRAALRAVRKVEAKGLTMRKRREVVHDFLYTVPLSPRAGQPVQVYYRPEATMLRGRPEIWLRAAWNRLGAAACNAAGGALRPLAVRLEPCLPGGLGFYKATVQVPSDAWGMDLSFSDTDSTSGGFVDDNGGLEYHIPVEGSATPRRSLSIVHVAVEMAPIAKVGGMGDVVTALGRAVQEQGHDVSVIVPKYDCINYALVDELVQDSGFHWGGTFVRVWRGFVEGLATTFLEPENGMFWVGCIYGRNNDAQRFGFFCGAALQYLKSTGRQYDLLHCHDWQSAPIAWGERGASKAMFTIHNLSYGADLIGRAMQSCNVATTVSPTYAREIAGHPSVASHLNKLYGVLNGIDQDIWDPSEDPCLPMHFSAENVAAGKEAARRLLRQRLNLAQADVPVVGCVTRLVAQKGIHLIKHAAWRTLERGGQFVLLGSAPDGRVQGEFNALRDQLARAYPDRAALVFTYDEPLSHLIYAGSDMFLVPSMFEPCGLTQMIAMRYGTIPVVRKTGGLVDTVFDVDHDEERARAKSMETNGFSFEGTDFAGMDYALNRALSCWYSDKPLWHSLRRRAMQQDWSWNSPALDYLELYYKALKS